MKNLVKKFGKGLTIAGLSAFLFCGCNLNKTEFIVLKEAQKISSVKEAEYLDKPMIHMHQYEKRMRKNLYDTKDMIEVFYGATGNEEINIGVMIFKKDKELEDNGNFYFIIDCFDSRVSKIKDTPAFARDMYYPQEAEGDKYKIKGHAESFRLEELLKTLHKIPKSSGSDFGGPIIIFPATIKEDEIKKQGSKEIHNGREYYVGVRYDARYSGEIKYLVLALEINKGGKEVNFKCHGNGERTIQKSF
jgi:hypothetical protein